MMMFVGIEIETVLDFVAMVRINSECVLQCQQGTHAILMFSAGVTLWHGVAFIPWKEVGRDN